MTEFIGTMTVSHQALQEQLTSAVQEIGHLIDPISTAARGEAAQLGHKVKTESKLYKLSRYNCKTFLSGYLCGRYNTQSLFPGDTVGELLRAGYRGIGGPGVQTRRPPATDEHTRSDQNPVRICATDALCCQRGRWKS